MLKNYAEKKVSQIMEKTTVDFVLVASSIYHCFFFLGPPLVMSDGVTVWLQAACSRLPEILLSVADSFSCYSIHSALSS